MILVKGADMENGKKQVSELEVLKARLAAVELTIKQLGAIKSIDHGHLKSLVSGGEAVTIPVSVQSIEIGALDDEKNTLCSVSIPKGVTQIPKGLFDGCALLAEVHWHDGITVVGDFAFSGCDALAKLAWPAKLQTVGMYAFRGCAFKTLDIPDSVSEIGKNAFVGCNQLTSVALPSHLEGKVAGVFPETCKLSFRLPSDAPIGTSSCVGSSSMNGGLSSAAEEEVVRASESPSQVL